MKDSARKTAVSRSANGEDGLPAHEWAGRRVLVLGCGNTLFGDDGFGPAVAESLGGREGLPADAAVFDAGTGVREVLFDIVLGGTRPEKIVVVDAVSVEGRAPGEVFKITVDELPSNKLDDFSLHQIPTSNLLRELSVECGVEVVIVAGQAVHIPGEVAPGLSPGMERAVERACGVVLAEVNGGRTCTK